LQGFPDERGDSLFVIDDQYQAHNFIPASNFVWSDSSGSKAQEHRFTHSLTNMLRRDLVSKPPRGRINTAIFPAAFRSRCIGPPISANYWQMSILADEPVKQVGNLKANFNRFAEPVNPRGTEFWSWGLGSY
jgi:hypothetical protein